jgi:hypothetical protein
MAALRWFDYEQEETRPPLNVGLIVVVVFLTLFWGGVGFALAWCVS